MENPEYFHCSDCDLTVHENDRENHINGAKHKYKTRQKVSENEKTELPYECDVCATRFSDLHFFTIHQGSKTHKRNLRRLHKNKKGVQEGPTVLAASVKPTGRRVPIQGIDKYLTINDFKDVTDYKSVREKYRPRNTKNPEGNNKAYISTLTAYWALSLTFDHAVKDFKICLNDKEWGDFGDAVVEIQLKPTEEHPELSTTFAIQFKNISNNVKAIDSIAEGKFAFAKYLVQVQALKLRKEVENRKFVVFTTAPVDVNMPKQATVTKELLHKTKQACSCNENEWKATVAAKSLSNRRKLHINTSDDNDNTFFFFCKDKVHALPKIYLYTHQKKQKHFGNLLDEIVFGALIDDQKVEIHREFVKYVDYWSDGCLGGSYKLKKEDVLVKIAHMLLYKFKIPPQAKQSLMENYGIWNQAVTKVDCTILKRHPTIVSKMCEPLNQKIERELNLKIDSTNCSVDLDQSVIKSIQNPLLKMYLFEETLGDIDDDVPLDVVYDFFWKAGLMPLPLEVGNLNDQEHVLNIINMLKYYGLTRRYLLMLDPISQNIKHSLRYYKNLTFFINVDDIASKLPAFLLNQVKIRVTDALSLSLSTIQDSDAFFHKTISAQEFFDMSLGRYSFKPFNNNLGRRHGDDTQLIMPDDSLVKLKKAIDSKDELKMALQWRDDADDDGRRLRGVRPNMFR